MCGENQMQRWASQHQHVPTDLQVLHILVAGALNPPPPPGPPFDNRLKMIFFLQIPSERRYKLVTKCFLPFANEM